MVGYAVEHLMEKLTTKYAELEAIVDFLQEVRNDLLQNVDAYKQAKEREEAQQNLPIPLGSAGGKPNFERYKVNLLVDNCDTQGTPVVVGVPLRREQDHVRTDDASAGESPTRAG